MEVMMLTYDQIKDKIFPCLIGMEINEKELSELVYTEMDGLAVTYHILIEGEILVPEANTIPITEQIREILNVSKEVLHETAISNLPRLMQPFSFAMDDMIISISNNNLYLGASIVLHEKFMYELINLIGDKFYVLPSSIHEVMLVPAIEENSNELEMLREIVHDVNESSCVLPQERLSYDVYQYDWKHRRLVRASK